MGFEGATRFRPPLAWEKAGRFIRWLMLKSCVTEPSAISVTREMLVALGVPTKNDCPYPTLAGADVIVGREPLNR